MSMFDLPRYGRSCWSSLKVFWLDVAAGLWAVCHHTVMLFGLTAVGVALLLGNRVDLRQQLEDNTLGWLRARAEARVPATIVAKATPEDIAATLRQALAEPDAIARATAADPSDLNRQQAAVAYWLARRYKVAPEPISRLVQEAWIVGRQAKIEPTLILAVMAVESGFNPFAQSAVGAQGLMQVMTRVHDTKYEAFGGQHAAFDPVTNLRVGVQVLAECIQRAGGSLEGGLKLYVGAANLEDDGGYGAKVVAEQARLRDVAAGKQVPVHSPLAPAANTNVVQSPAAGGGPAGPSMLPSHPVSVPAAPAPASGAAVEPESAPVDKVAFAD